MTIHKLNAHINKRARSLAEEGNKNLTRAANCLKLCNFVIDKFCKHREDYSEIKKAMDQIENIVINSIQRFYTDKLTEILQPVQQTQIQEPANESAQTEEASKTES